MNLRNGALITILSTMSTIGGCERTGSDISEKTIRYVGGEPVEMRLRLIEASSPNRINLQDLGYKQFVNDSNIVRQGEVNGGYNCNKVIETLYKLTLSNELSAYALRRTCEHGEWFISAWREDGLKGNGWACLHGHPGCD